MSLARSSERPYIVPIIVGQGSGRGFALEGLKIPKDIFPLEQNKITGSRTNIDVAMTLQDIVNEQSIIRREYPIGGFFDYGEDGALEDVKLHLPREPRLLLNRLFEPLPYYEYIFVNVSSLDVAVFLQMLGAQFVENLGFDIAYIRGGDYSFHSKNLRVPKLVEIEDRRPYTSRYYQERGFLVEASNIAGRFGIELNRLSFDERGILSEVDVEGDACMYYIKPDNTYGVHNVDSPEQAATLHGIVGSHLNFLMQTNLNLIQPGGLTS